MRQLLRTIGIATIITTSIVAFSWAQETSLPIHGACGDLDNTSVEIFPNQSNQEKALCNEGEFDQWHWTVQSGGIQNFTRMCKGTNGGTTDLCSAQGSAMFYENQIAESCGSSAGKAFMTTTSPLGIAYTNYQNVFLGNLCQNTDARGNIQSTAPIRFNQTPLGRVRQCPTLSGNLHCGSSLYFHAQCGIAANTGHTNTPTTQLCAPGNISSTINFDSDNLLRRWNCDGGGEGNMAYCQARIQTGTEHIQPSCNPTIIHSDRSIFETGDYLTQFPGINACSQGILSYRMVSDDQSIQWKCNVQEKEGGMCPTVYLPSFETNAGSQCEPSSNGQSFKGLSQLLSNGLCAGKGTPSYFQDMGDRWLRSCGSESCEASKTNERRCGRASYAPRKTHPTEGLCQTGIVDMINPLDQKGYFRERSCVDQYNPNNRTECKSPRIVDGECTWQTLLDTDGFTTPQQLLDAGLCSDGIPQPLVPLNNTEQKMRTWQCVSPTALGAHSPLCKANAKLPEISVVFEPEKPSSGTVTGPIKVSLSGFDPIYMNFTNPPGQRYRLFTHNGDFNFEYSDRAGNTGETYVRIDWIDEDLPGAQVEISPTSRTTGNVLAQLTGLTHEDMEINFLGTCLTNGTCKKKDHPYNKKDRTIEFLDNGEGYFTLTNQNGTTTLPVSIEHIDRTVPNVNIHYSNLNDTAENVIATLINPSEEIIITNNSGSTSYTFTESGSFVFEIEDLAGNAINLTATVTRIDKDVPMATVYYSETGTTTSDVVATLGDFSETGTIIVNNGGDPSYTFTYNHEFTFILEDEVGNRGSVTAKVDRINKPILQDIINEYEKYICHKFKKRLPIDIQGNEYNFHIITAIRNCLMKGYTMKNNHTYFFPRKAITRGEFITIIGRFIRMMTEYEGEAVNELSENFIGVVGTGQFGPEISEADAWGLLFYAPIIQSGTQKYINTNGPVSAREAKRMLRRALEIGGRDDKILDHIILEKDNLTRGEVAFILTNLIQNYKDVAIGNNLEFLRFLHTRTNHLTPQAAKKIIVQIIIKLKKIDENTFLRVGLDPQQLLADLADIAQGKTPTKQHKRYIRIKTIMDDYLRNYEDPFNNEHFNYSHVYTDQMFEDQSTYPYNNMIADPYQSEE